MLLQLTRCAVCPAVLLSWLVSGHQSSRVFCLQAVHIHPTNYSCTHKAHKQKMSLPDLISEEPILGRPPACGDNPTPCPPGRSLTTVSRYSLALSSLPWPEEPCVHMGMGWVGDSRLAFRTRSPVTWTFFLAERQHHLDENCPLHVEHSQYLSLKLPHPQISLALVTGMWSGHLINWQSLWQRQFWLLKKNRCLGNHAEEAVEVEKWTLLAPSGPGAWCFGREPNSGGTGPYAAAIQSTSITHEYLWLSLRPPVSLPTSGAFPWGGNSLWLLLGWGLLIVLTHRTSRWTQEQTMQEMFLDFHAWVTQPLPSSLLIVLSCFFFCK